MQTQNLKIDALGLRHRLKVIIISEAVGMAKPDPAIFHLAAEGLGVSLSELWYVGDHPNYPEPDLQLTRLTDLLNLLPSNK